MWNQKNQNLFEMTRTSSNLLRHQLISLLFRNNTDPLPERMHTAERFLITVDG